MGAKRLNWDEVEEFRRIRVLVVDDSTVWLESVCNLIGTSEVFQTVGTATGGFEALNQSAVLQPDLILMNLYMPDLNGLETARRMRRKFPYVRVVMLTECDQPGGSLLKACEFNGVNGLVTKRRIREELMTEIQQAFARPSSASGSFG
jgi:DNA-binding NarL/FixJ family response regulator